MSKEQEAASLSPQLMVLGSPVFAEHARPVIKQANWSLGYRPQTHINISTGKRVGTSLQQEPSYLNLAFRATSAGSVDVLRFYIKILPETVSVTVGAECYMEGGEGSVAFTVGSALTTLSFSHGSGDSGTEKTASLATSATGTGWLSCSIAIEKTSGTDDINLSRVRIQDEPITSGLESPSIEGDSETMDVQEEGTAVVLSARKINFIGADITAASGGSGVANVTVTGGGGASLPVVDTTSIAKGSVDATKEIRLEADTNIATGTTRVITMANENIDLTPDTGAYQAAAMNVEAHSTSASVTGRNKILNVDSSSAPVTLTLPPIATAGSGAWFTIKDAMGMAATYPITLDADSAEMIDNSGSQILSLVWSSLTVYTDGSTRWFLRG